MGKDRGNRLLTALIVWSLIIAGVSVGGYNLLAFSREQVGLQVALQFEKH